MWDDQLSIRMQGRWGDSHAIKKLGVLFEWLIDLRQVSLLGLSQKKTRGCGPEKQLRKE